MHYFPTQNKQDSSDTDFSSWCGWHNDHGSLTGLLPGMYLNDKDGTPTNSPDETAGLYVKARNGNTVQVQFPFQNNNCIAFQIGETTQIHTGGILQATPHCVKGITTKSTTYNNVDISRESFAVFMEPELDGNMDLPSGKTIQDVQNQDKSELFLPKGVRTLHSRFVPGMNFGEFSQATFQDFH